MSMASLSMVADFVHGRLWGSDRPFEAVSTDTRTLQAGELFVALRGERFDAAQFVAEAERLGAAGAVVENRQPVALPQVEVGDTRRALGDLARAWRQRFRLPVIGITGSNGKTTVRALTAAILAADAADPAEVLATEGNLNNDIGLPLMVLRLRACHRAAVFEMGASRAGEIDYLAGIAQPAIGVVTNAGPAHLAGFGSVAGVARAKGELFARLPDEGIAIINRDDPWYDEWRQRAGQRAVLSFGLQTSADFHLRDLRRELGDAGESWSFTLQGPLGALPVRLPMAGQHNLRNALAAAAAATAAGVSAEAIVLGLAAAAHVRGRLQRLLTPTGAVLYDDSYNANPASVRAAIEFLASQPGETWLVLGDMAELGADSEALHRAIGAVARDAGITRLFAVGQQAALAADEFGPAALRFAAADDAIAGLPSPPAGTQVLVKASRSMGLDAVVAALSGEEG